MEMKRIAMMLLLAATMASCGVNRENVDSGWGDAGSWYDGIREADTEKADVFYVLSTNVLSSVDSAGVESFNALLGDGEREIMNMEFAYMDDLFGDSFNFYAPYYHQFTMSSTLSEDNYAAAYGVAVEDVESAFDYYMAHFNNGRPFVLAGFSQGAMHVLSLLKHMTDEQYSRMVAAYMMGYRVTAEDLEHPHVVAAEDATTKGVTVSFNSVADTSAIWHSITDGAATCINPVTWTTDSTPAPMFYGEDSLSISVLPEYNVLLVGDIDVDSYVFAPLEPFVARGNLHHWDILFYHDYIRENAILRAYGR